MKYESSGRDNIWHFGIVASTFKIRVVWKYRLFHMPSIPEVACVAVQWYGRSIRKYSTCHTRLASNSRAMHFWLYCYRCNNRKFLIFYFFTFWTIPQKNACSTETCQGITKKKSILRVSRACDRQTDESKYHDKTAGLIDISNIAHSYLCIFVKKQWA